MKRTFIATSVDAANRYVRIIRDIVVTADIDLVDPPSSVTGYKIELDSELMTYDSFIQENEIQDWQACSNNKKLSSLDQLNREIEAGHLIEA